MRGTVRYLVTVSVALTRWILLQIQKSILSLSCTGVMSTQSVLERATMKRSVLQRRCAMHIRNRWWLKIHSKHHHNKCLILKCIFKIFCMILFCLLFYVTTFLFVLSCSAVGCKGLLDLFLFFCVLICNFVTVFTTDTALVASHINNWCSV